MKKLIHKILVLTGLILLQSCNLDSMIYSDQGGDGTIDGYQLLQPGWGDSLGFPVADSMRHLFPLNSTGEEVEDATIIGLYLGDLNEIATDTVILFCHGNGPTLDIFWEQLSLLANMGSRHQYGVMAIDYRGYGNSTGQASPNGFIADVNAAMRWLSAQGLTEDRLIIHGYSLGGMPAVLGAVYGEMKPDRLIAEAPFTGADSPMQTSTGLSLPGSLISEIGTVSTPTDIKGYDGPLFWLHAKDDQTVAFKYGEELYNNHTGVFKSALNPNEGGHYLLDHFGPVLYSGYLLDFIRQPK